MERGFSTRVTIKRPREEVWNYLTDFAHAAEWMKGVDSMNQTSDGPLGVGTRFVFRARGADHVTEVTAYEPLQQISLTSTQGGITATYNYLLKDIGEDTELILNARCEASGLWRLVHPLVVYAMKRSDAPQVQNVKAALE